MVFPQHVQDLVLGPRIPSACHVYSVRLNAHGVCRARSVAPSKVRTAASAYSSEILCSDIDLRVARCGTLNAWRRADPVALCERRGPCPSEAIVCAGHLGRASEATWRAGSESRKQRHAADALHRRAEARAAPAERTRSIRRQPDESAARRDQARARRRHRGTGGYRLPQLGRRDRGTQRRQAPEDPVKLLDRFLTPKGAAAGDERPRREGECAPRAQGGVSGRRLRHALPARHEGHSEGDAADRRSSADPVRRRRSHRGRHRRDDLRHPSHQARDRGPLRPRGGTRARTGERRQGKRACRTAARGAAARALQLRPPDRAARPRSRGVVRAPPDRRRALRGDAAGRPARRRTAGACADGRDVPALRRVGDRRGERAA